MFKKCQHQAHPHTLFFQVWSFLNSIIPFYHDKVQPA